MTLPSGTDLWSATVNDAAVVPVSDGNASLIPLPQRADPNAVLTVDLKLAARSADAQHLTLAAPIAGAPVMLEKWIMEPDAGRRLVFRSGSLTPAGGVVDVSGFAELARLFRGPEAAQAEFFLLAMVVLVGIAVMAWRWTAREGAQRSGTRPLAGMLGGAAAFVLAILALIKVAGLASNMNTVVPHELTFLAPVQQADSALNVEVSNLADKPAAFEFLGYVWPALLAIAVWAFAWMTNRGGYGFVGLGFGWRGRLCDFPMVRRHFSWCWRCFYSCTSAFRCCAGHGNCGGGERRHHRLQPRRPAERPRLLRCWSAA